MFVIEFGNPDPLYSVGKYKKNNDLNSLFTLHYTDIFKINLACLYI